MNKIKPTNKVLISKNSDELYGDRTGWPYFVMSNGSIERGISPSSLTEIITKKGYSQVPKKIMDQAKDRGIGCEYAIKKFIETRDYGIALDGAKDAWIKNLKRAFHYLEIKYLQWGYKLHSYQKELHKYPYTCQKDIELISPKGKIVTLECKTNTQHYNIPLVFLVQLFIQHGCSNPKGQNINQHYLFWIKDVQIGCKPFVEANAKIPIREIVKELTRIYKLNLPIEESHKIFIDYLIAKKIPKKYWQSRHERGLPKNGKKTIKHTSDTRTKKLEQRKD